MALNASLNKFRSELSDATTRNVQYSRPAAAAPSRIATPKPAAADNKRTHEAAFNKATSNTPTAPPPSTGRDILTQVTFAVAYLKEKSPHPVTLDDLISYLSLDNTQQRHIPRIEQALQRNERVTYISKSESTNGKVSLQYRPLHNVFDAEALKNYVALQTSGQGLSVKELKDGWPDCNTAIDQLEKQGFLLVTRRKKDNTPITIWADSPTYHILSNNTHLPQKIDSDFADFWAKTKLPASELEMRTELEKAGLTPTSQVKEVNKLGDGKRKERKRINRRGGKTTNAHMLGILKDYTKK